MTYKHEFSYYFQTSFKDSLRPELPPARLLAGLAPPELRRAQSFFRAQVALGQPAAWVGVHWEQGVGGGWEGLREKQNLTLQSGSNELLQAVEGGIAATRAAVLTLPSEAMSWSCP